jgi:DNA-binding GntR family transcriptional regulator
MSSAEAGPPVRLERRALRDGAYDLLLDMLLDGSLQPGVNLSIDGLARQLGVSPTPIREALVNLEHTGLVTRAALRGYRVAPEFSAEQIGQLVDARAIVELGALDQALRHRDELIPVLRLAHERHQQVIADIDATEGSLTGSARIAGYRRYFEADWGFHLAIMRQADNPFIVQLAESLGAHVHRLRQTVGVGLTDSHQASTEHARILDALETSAPDEVVRDALREHLEAVRSRSIADSLLDRA